MLGHNPKNLIWIGLVLVILGAVVPFLMVMGILQSSFFLNFFSYISSVLGLFLGIIGASMIIRQNRK
jgi:hypothetical protein